MKPLQTLTLTVLALSLSLPAQAALIRKTFTVTIPNPTALTGQGEFSYDDTSFIPDGANFYSSITDILFGYGSDPLASITDPLARVNFDSSQTFLGIDLEIPLADNSGDILLLGNEDAYLGPDFDLTENAVTYANANSTPIPTPALLPGLLLFAAKLRRKVV
jgi:hypothetical protein